MQENASGRDAQRRGVLRRDTRGQVGVEYLLLLAVVGLGILTALRGLAGIGLDLSHREGEAIRTLSLLDSGGGDGDGMMVRTVSTSNALEAAQPRRSGNLQLVASHESADSEDEGGGALGWVKEFAGALVERGPELVLDTALTVAGVLMMEAGTGMMGGGGAVSLSGVGAVVGVPVVVAGAALTALGAVTAGVGIYAMASDLGDAAQAASERNRGSSGESQDARKPLEKGKPNPDARAKGPPEEVDPRASSQKQADVRAQNESADRLAREGYDIEHNTQTAPSGRVPDYKIQGEFVDHLNVRSGNVEQARKAVQSKVDAAHVQAERLVLRLDDSSLTPDDVIGILQRKPVSNLKEVIFIKGDAVTPFVP